MSRLVACVIGTCFVACVIGTTACLLIFGGSKLSIRVGRCVCIAMECDEIIDQLLETGAAAGPTTVAPGPTTVAQPAVAPPTHNTEGEVGKKRQRLAALAAGGQSKQYLGRVLSADQIEDLSNEETQKLYARYEARLGASMTQTLGSALLQLYSTLAGQLLPIPADRHVLLVADLEADPFVGHALSAATCELYHRYGMYLAPVTAMLSTIKHCRRPSDKAYNGDTTSDTGGDTDGGAGGGGATGDAGTGERNY